MVALVEAISRPGTLPFRLGPEVEPTPRDLIFLSGASSVTGQAIASRFAREGYEIIAGSSTSDKFAGVREEIIAQGGKEPRPFIADITDSEQIAEAYRALEMPPGTRMHFVFAAAAGIEDKGFVARQIASLAVMHRRGTLTPEKAGEATQKIKEYVWTEEGKKKAMDVNFHGALALEDILEENGHLNSESTILTTSSILSHSCDPYNIDSYLGPWFYYPVALTKQLAVAEISRRARRLGATYVDLVIPEIEATPAGNFIEKLKPLLEALNGGNEIGMTVVSKEQVAEAVFREVGRNTPLVPRVRTVYLEESGDLSYERPSSWSSFSTPYL